MILYPILQLSIFLSIELNLLIEYTFRSRVDPRSRSYCVFRIYLILLTVLILHQFKFKLSDLFIMPFNQQSSFSFVFLEILLFTTTSLLDYYVGQFRVEIIEPLSDLWLDVLLGVIRAGHHPSSDLIVLSFEFVDDLSFEYLRWLDI